MKYRLGLVRRRRLVMRALESSDFAAVDRGGSYIGFLPNDGRIIARFL
jgi:hypothetical protein